MLMDQGAVARRIVAVGGDGRAGGGGGDAVGVVIDGGGHAGPLGQERAVARGVVGVLEVKAVVAAALRLMVLCHLQQTGLL